MRRTEKRSQKSRGQNLEVQGAGGCTVLGSLTFALRVLTFLRTADRPALQKSVTFRTWKRGASATGAREKGKIIHSKPITI
jgi:hypothetical protein